MKKKELVFDKKGSEIKESIKGRLKELEIRLNKRNNDLDEFLNDTKKIRAYLIRSAKPEFRGDNLGQGLLYSKDDLSSEERKEIEQLCVRIQQLEIEIYKLKLIVNHLNDDDIFDLSFNELLLYGFDTE